MKKFLSLIFIAVFPVLLFAQAPTNDDCANATPIVIPSSGNICFTGTNLNATSDGVFSAGCTAPTGGDEVWYTFIATGSNNTITVTPTGSPAAQKVAVTIDNGGCGSGSIHTCVASATNGGAATATWTFAVGTQVWFEVTSLVSDGQFEVCITSDTPPPAPGKTCATATKLCDKSSFSVTTIPTGSTGFSPQCWPAFSSVQREVWYKFTVGVTGTLEWTATPKGAVEYDWALYDITSSCPTGSTAPVSCNYNYAGASGATIGMQSAVTTCTGVELCPAVTVTAGRTYMILIDNYSANATGFDFDWGGTFEMAPNADFTATPTIGCNSVTTSFTNTSAASVSSSWSFGDGTTSTVTNPPSHTYSTAGSYLVSLTATSASGCVNNTSQVVTVSKPTATVSPATSTICSGQSVNLTGSYTLTSFQSPITFTKTATSAIPDNNATGVSSVINVSNIFPSVIASGTIASVCIKIAHVNDGDLTIKLQCPNGTIINLSQNNGAAGDHYSGTCFSPSAAASITTGTAPFVGSFLPQQSFNLLNGCNANGNWTLIVIDNKNGNVGSLTEWSITLNNKNSSTFTWSPTTNLAGSATLTPVATPTATTTYTFSVTDAAGCTATSSATINVNPVPVASGTSKRICSGSSPAVALTSTVVGTTFSWNTPVISGTVTGATSGSGTSINNTLFNTAATAGTATYSVTPTANGCVGTPLSVVITVDPVPVAVATPTSQTFCGNNTTGITISSTTTGATFAWTVAGGVTGSLAGTGNSIAQALSNSTTSSQTATYTITPTGPSPQFCVGSPITVPITITPLPTVTAAPSPARICSGVGAGVTLTSNIGTATFAWNTPTVSGTISGGASGTGSSINTVLTNTGTSSGTVTYSVTPTANGCAGSPVSVVVTVDAVPVATATPSTQTLCSGGTTGINITANVASSSFAWTVAGGVSGSAAGTGSSIAQTLTNAGSSSQTATYTITPTGPAPGNCPGASIPVTITVNPIPSVIASPSSQRICSGSASSILLSGPVTGTTYSWGLPVVTGGITGSSASTGVGISQTLTNPGTSSGTVTYSVTPTASGCPGAPVTVVVTVDPTPSVTATPALQNICSGTSSAVSLTSPVAGTTFGWTVAGGVSGSSGGTGNNITQTLSNLSTSVKTAVYTVTPTGPAPSLCVGPTGTVTINVYPIPDAIPAPATQTICSGTGATINITSSVGSTTFGWTALGGVSGSSSGTGSSISQTLSNAGATAVTATYAITPTGPAPASCVGAVVNATVVVNPLPAAPAVISPINYCQGAVASALTATGSNLKWYDGAGVLIGATAPTPSTAVVTSLTYQVSQTVSGCEGPKASITVIINGPPVAPSSASPLVYCQGQTIPALVATGSGAAGSTLKWYSDAALSSQVGTGSPYNAGITVTTTLYVIEESLAGCKSAATAVTVTVNPKDNASFTYGSTTYCRTGSNPTPTAVTPGGSYVSSPAGLSITASTGTISLSGSTVGVYKIVYTTAGSCPNKDSLNITITDSPDPTFSIAGPYCQYGTNPAPVFIAPATPGVFSASPAGMVFDVNTGEVDLSLSSPGVYTLTNTIAAGGGCAQVADSHPVTINLTPSVTGNNDTICSGGTTNIVFNNPNAGTINTWTITAISGPVSGASAGTGAGISQSLTITGTVAGSVTYHVVPTTSGGSSCTGSPIDVVAVVNPLPAAPAVTSPVTYCQGSAAVALSATATTGVIQWYDAANTYIGTTAPVPSTATATTLTYYASEKIGKCEGAKSPITVTINATPAAPVAPAPAAYCQGAVIAPLTASGTGGTFKWYSDAALSSQVGVGTPFSTGVSTTSDFWVTETKSGCTGPGTKVSITVNPKDDASFSYSSGTFCITGTNPTPTSIATPGGTFSAASPVVINAATGQINLTATGLGGPYDITYTTNGTCPSSSVVKVTITNAPSATFSYAGPYCSSAVNPLPTIPAGSSSGVFSSSPATLVWVNNTTGEINLSSTPAGTYTITNFIASLGGCAAATATNTVTINASPAAPGTAPVVYCENAVATALTATPSATGTLNWYPGPTGTAPVPATTPGNTTTTYQVSQTVNGCEGPKGSIAVTINPTPAAPVAPSPAAYCQGAAIASLTAGGSGGTLKWYKALPLTVPNQVGTGSPFPSGAVSTSSFYVTETVTGCEGPSTKVDITVNPLDNPAFSYSSGTYCVSGVTNPSPTPSSPGGSYSSSPAGLTMSSTTGQITLATSLPNTYTITYTTNGLCPQSSTQTVSIVTSAIAGFSYGGPYCKNDPNPSPVFVAGASAGTFTSVPAGLSLNAATGQVTLSTSLAGTYTVTNTITGGGCVPVSATATIKVNGTPAAPGVAPLTYCKGVAAPALTAAGSNLIWYNGAAPFGTVVPTPTPSTATAATTSYYVSQTVNGCESARAVLVVTVNDLPAAPVVSNVSYCKNATAVPLTSSAVNANWYSPIANVLAGAPTPSTSSTVTTSYWVTETTNGCEGPKSKLQVFINFTSPPVTSNLTLCENDVASPLTATLTAGATAQWYDALNTPISVPTPVTTPTGTTTYNVTQTLNSCESAPSPLIVTVNAPPVPQVATPVTYCQGAIATALSAQVTTAGNTLKWYDGTNTYIGTTAPVPSTTTSGTYSWYVSQVSATNPAGCEGAKAKIDVIINFTPAPVVTSPVIYCQGSAATALTPNGGNLLWYTTLNGTGGVASITPSTVAPAVFNYYVEDTQNNCPSVRTQLTVNVNAAPIPPQLTAPTICAQNTATLTPTAPGGCSYTWYDATGTTVLASGASFSTPVLSTTTSYQVEATDNATGCIGPKATYTVTVNTPITPTAQPASTCQGTTTGVSVDLPTVPGATYNWYSQPAGGSIYDTGPAITTQILNATTTLYVEALLNGCVGGRIPVVITVNPTITPQVSITPPPSPVCAGSTVSFWAVPTNGGASPSYQWAKNGTPLGGNNNPQNDIPQDGDIYTVTMTSSVQCPSGLATGTDTISVTNLTTPSVTIVANPNPICKGMMVNFSIKNLSGQGTNPTYDWQLNGTTQSTLVGGFSSSTLNNNDVITLVMTSNVVCPAKTQARDSVTMQVNAAPVINISPMNAQGCDPLTVDYTLSPNMTYKWSFTGTDTTDVTSATYSHTYHYSNGQPQSVGIRVIDQNGCYSKGIITATAYEQPVADFSYSPDVISNLSPVVEVTDHTAGVVNSWTWSYSDGKMGSGKTMEHQFPKEGDYSIGLRVTNTATGCTDTINKTVTVIEDYAFYIPDAFSPNGDGVNDTFSPNGIGVKGYDMWIFDRWGSELYHTSEMSKGWEGKAFGKTELAQLDVYVYKIITTDYLKKKHEYVGKVQVIR